MKPIHGHRARRNFHPHREWSTDGSDVDDDPDSGNDQSGISEIEIEATTKVSVRNIWLKKLNRR
jgi:hypothetical protein